MSALDQLTNPLVVIDVETTGVHFKVDRIVQVGLIKLYPDGKRNEWKSYINPTVPIPPEVSRIHGITDETVKDAPKFVDVAPTLVTGLTRCDFAGYNVDFDLEFIRQEIVRIGGKPDVIDNGRIIDAFRIFKRYERRDLSSAVQRYLKREMKTGAHDALVDVQETLEVIRAQLVEHEELLELTVEQLHRKFFETPQEGHLDPDGKFAWRFGEAVLNFGKHATVPLSRVDKSYLRWIIQGDFPVGVKDIARAALAGDYPRRSSSGR